MKVVILAGGFGTRLSEETIHRPKPMVEIGGYPILWHIMKHYSNFGFSDFIICLGYLGYQIKEYFSNYFLHNSDVTIDLKTNQMKIHSIGSDPWRVTLVNTGEATMTGGRIKRIAPFIEGESFCMTYGDGVSDIDVGKLVEFHKDHGKLATVTAVQPPGRFGTLNLDNHTVLSFKEKVEGDSGWINGGFFVLNREVLDFIDGDQSVWEKEPIQKISAAGQLMAFYHRGFWQPMDTIREKHYLEELWRHGKAPWRAQ